MLELKNIVKKYGNNVILDDISLQIKKGEIVSILGPSGSGKTTLLNLILGITDISSGKIIYDGEDITNVPLEKRGFNIVFQDYALFPNLTAYENIVYGLRNKPGISTEQDVQDFIHLLGLEEHLNKRISQLSGGQKQRVAIARALATEPKVILCDEATSALDPNTTKSILALLKDLNRKMGITVVVITHEMDVISSICDNVAIIDKGDIVERGPVKEIFESPKSHIGKQLIMGDAIKETDFSGGRYFRITFDGREAGEPVISNLVLRTKVPVNIMYAQTKAIGNKAVGEMVIQFSENEENVDSALNYLKTVNIPFEEVTENDF